MGILEFHSYFQKKNDDDGMTGNKRELELDKPEFFVAEESGGAYHVMDMPKKYKCE